jgi:hypothetical protein
MIDENLARLRAHRQNIERYRRLLETNLTVLERDFVERRITEEESALDRLASDTFPLVLKMPRKAVWCRACSAEAAAVTTTSFEQARTDFAEPWSTLPSWCAYGPLAFAEEPVPRIEMRMAGLDGGETDFGHGRNDTKGIV